MGKLQIFYYLSSELLASVELLYIQTEFLCCYIFLVCISCGTYVTNFFPINSSRKKHKNLDFKITYLKNKNESLYVVQLWCRLSVFESRI